MGYHITFWMDAAIARDVETFLCQYDFGSPLVAGLVMITTSHDEIVGWLRLRLKKCTISQMEIAFENSASMLYCT